LEQEKRETEAKKEDVTWEKGQGTTEEKKDCTSDVKTADLAEVKKEKFSWTIIVMIIVLVVLIGAVIGMGVYFYNNTVYRHCVAEAGTEVLPADFAINPDIELAFAEDSPEFDILVPGDYPVILKAWFIKFNSTLTIEDTIPPTAEVGDLVIEAGDSIAAKDFLSNISDVTMTSASFVEPPDVYHYGTQDVKIRLKDLGENEVIYEVKLTISPLVDSITIEAGEECPDEKEFLISEDATTVYIISDLAMIDTSKIGEYNITFGENHRLFYSKLIIVDTTTPTLVLHNVNGYLTSAITKESFITEASDVSEFTVEYEKSPDMTKEGEQEISMVATDIAGNETRKTAKLTLQKDTEPPVISGVKDINIFIGESISYRNGIKVTDNCDTGASLDIDTGGANNKAEGQYTITYKAVDKAGNTTVETAILTVRQVSYDQATIDAMADAVLARIITDGMDNRSKLNAIYNWVRGNMAYANHSDKSNWLKGAYEGFKYHRGDCFVYFATTKALLNRAGIANMDIQKMPGYRTMHYWNLVDIGEGWHHFDTTPRRGGGVFNYLTDAQMMSYSETHGNSHIYDRSLYPAIP